MKTIDYYMNLPYKMEIIPDKEEGGFVALFPELPGCITVGDTIEEIVSNILDAKRAWLEAGLEEGRTIPEPANVEDYSGQFKLRIPKSLHKQLAEHSKKEGISMNQYCLYLLSRNDALYVK
jgi:predicted RNase H-like HicB family nuclease